MLYGSEDSYFDTQSAIWIFDIPSQTWRQYKSKKDHSRDKHRGTRGLNGCVIIVGGTIDTAESYDNYTATFTVMLEPKTLQQLAIQTTYKHRDDLPLKYLPRKLTNLLGISKPDDDTRRLMQ